MHSLHYVQIINRTHGHKTREITVEVTYILFLSMITLLTLILHDII